MLPPGPGGQVVVHLGVRETGKLDDGTLLPGELQVVRPAPEDDAGPQFMMPAAQLPQDAAGVGLIGGLEDCLAVDPADGVGGQDDPADTVAATAAALSQDTACTKVRGS